MALHKKRTPLDPKVMEAALGAIDAAVEALALQLTIAAQPAEVLLQDMWALGYAYGYFESAVHGAGVLDVTNQCVYVEIGLGALFLNDPHTETAMRQLHLFGNGEEFAKGKTEGARELRRFIGDKTLDPTDPPMALRLHLKGAR